MLLLGFHSTMIVSSKASLSAEKGKIVSTCPSKQTSDRKLLQQNRQTTEWSRRLMKRLADVMLFPTAIFGGGLTPRK